MTWVKVDDHLADHPKVLGLGKLAPLALALQIRALCYCSRYLTDGRVPAGAIPGLLDGFDAWGIETASVPGMFAIGVEADELDWPAMMVRAGLWERLRGGDYLIHDYLDYNPSRESVLLEREGNKRRQKNFRKRNAHRNGVTNGPVTGAPSPSPNPITETSSPAAEPPPVVHTDVETRWNETLAPIVRECWWSDDRTHRPDEDGKPWSMRRDMSMLKVAVKRGRNPDELEPAIRGLRLLPAYRDQPVDARLLTDRTVWALAVAEYWASVNSEKQRRREGGLSRIDVKVPGAA